MFSLKLYYCILDPINCHIVFACVLAIIFGILIIYKLKILKTYDGSFYDVVYSPFYCLCRCDHFWYTYHLQTKNIKKLWWIFL